MRPAYLDRVMHTGPIAPASRAARAPATVELNPGPVLVQALRSLRGPLSGGVASIPLRLGAVVTHYAGDAVRSLCAG